MLGHELRNPLSPILTALQLMKLRGSDGAERERTVIERQVNHLTRLVDDLLDVSRIARGRVELKEEVVEMAVVVAKAIEMASLLLEQRTQSLAVDVARHGLPVHGDPTRLSQVVSNLLTNAAKYTPPGGHITVRGEHDQRDVVLRVKDTGIGIAPNVLPRVFDLFVQERQALDRSQGGLGLGLTIVRNLVERHHGSVSAHSDGPGRGSEFVVRLPRAVSGVETEARQPRACQQPRAATSSAQNPRRRR
jgi:signal transduction histidine kinase